MQDPDIKPADQDLASANKSEPKHELTQLTLSPSTAKKGVKSTFQDSLH